MNAYSVRNKELYYRLIAFWVVCEAFTGGIMHAAKLPFTGMIISSFSVTCIILIAYFIPSGSGIIRATFIVMVFKLMLSPYSPPTAYLAVFLQGFVGQLLFYNKKPVLATAMLLAVLALVESAVQRILVLLIIYGNTFWHAVDRFVIKLVGGGDKNYSLMLASGYILVHALAGIFVGIFAMRLVKMSYKGRSGDIPRLNDPQIPQTPVLPAAGRNNKTKFLSLSLWVFLVLLLLQSAVDPANAVLRANETLLIFLRSILIVSGWYLILTPLIMKMLKAGLRSQQQKNSSALNEILLLLPGTKNIFTQSWKLSAAGTGLNRVKLFLKILTANILFEKGPTRD